MPTGVYDRRKAKPRKDREYIGPSDNLQRLLDMQRELQERIDAERQHSSARNKLVAFVNKHALTAKDLREVAKIIGERKVGDAPVTSKYARKASRHRSDSGKAHPPIKDAVGIGKVIREARLALGLSASQVSEAIGQSHSVVGKIERGHHRVTEATAPKLAKVLKLPVEALQPKTNGHAPAH